MADEIIQDPLEAANYLLRQYRDNPDFEFTQEEASLVHNAYQGGVSFVDSKPVMDEASTSSFLRSQDESDPTFIASEEEFSILKATEPGAMSRIGAGMTGAAEYFGPVIKEGVPELLRTAAMREPRPGEPSLPATLLEAGARGTVDLGTMAVGASKFIEKAPFMAAGALGLQDDYKSYLNQKTIDQNYQMQAIDKMNAERAQGKSIIGLPEGTFAPKAAEAASMVLDPTLAVPFIGPGAKATGVAGRGLGATTKIARGIETAARATGGAIDLGVEKVGQGIQRVLPGVTAPKTAGAIATGAAAIGIPGAFPIGAKVAGVRAGAEIAERGAQAVRIAGEEAMTGPSRMTVMERVAKNQKNPEWLRKAANTSIVSSPITQGAAELGLETGKGAVKSAAVGAGLGYVASGGEEEGIGGGLVIGGGLGTIGGAVKGVAAIPAKKALAKQGDVNRLFARQADLGLDVNKIADYVRKDNRPFLDAATLQMMAPDVQVEFHGRDSFMMPENAGINAAGVVKAVPDKSGTTRLLVNMDDMRSSGDTVKHEIMHAIMKSPAINKAEGRMAVMSEYGEEGLRRFGNEYARKLLEGERQGRGAPTEAEVRAKANELREGSQRSEPGAGDLDWIADEVLAEQFVGEFRGKDLDSLRRKTLPGTDLLSMQEGFLAPVGRLLNKFGIDTTGPKPTNIDTLFKDNPLVPSKQLRELTSRWFRDRDKYLDGLEKAEKQKDVTLVPGPGNRNLANNPAVKFTRNRKTNLEENDFAVRFPDGTVRAKDPASILAVDKARVADVGRLYNPDAVLERGSPEFGVKIQSDGKPYVGGNTLPEGFFNLDSFNDFTKEVAKALQDSRQEGKTYSVWYQKIGTGEDGSWAQSVKRGLGNIKVGQSEIAFLGWRLSKAGNILAQAVDISALRGRMLDFARSGKGRINEVWGGDLASYEKDVMQYLDNHANERPGETGIGIDKRNAINYLFGITNIANKNANPMYAAEGRPPGSLVKSYRLDRIANSRDTGRTGFFFDYQKQAANLAPGDYSMAIAIRDMMPDIADADQVKAILRPGKARGVNEEDLKFSGVIDQIDKLASEGNGKVRKEDMMKFLTGEGFVKIKKTVLKDYKPEPLSAQESTRLKLLEAENEKNPLGGIEETVGEGSYNELMDLQNRRDKFTNIFWLQDEEVSTEAMANKLFSGPGKDKQFKRMMDQAAHFGARAERLDKVLSDDRKNQPQYADYQLPGGTEYQETILSKERENKSNTGPTRVEFRGSSDVDSFLVDMDAMGFGSLEYGRLDNDPTIVEFDGPIPEKVIQLISKYDGQGNVTESNKIYFGKHYGEQGINAMAASRAHRRKDVLGRSIRFIDETQSDWHQDGRKYGYREDTDLFKVEEELRKKYGSPLVFDLLSKEDADRLVKAEAENKFSANRMTEQSVPDAPFRKDWPIQTFKQELFKAVDDGDKALAWTKGETQFARWGSERVDWAKSTQDGVDGYLVHVKSFTRDPGPAKDAVDASLVKFVRTKEDFAAVLQEQSIGDENNVFADKVWKKMQETPSGTSMPRKEGMEKFYDKMLPSEANKYMKQFGAKVVESATYDPVDKRNVPIWSVDITPEVVAGVRKMQAIEKEFSAYGQGKPKSSILGEEQKQFAPATTEEDKLRELASSVSGLKNAIKFMTPDEQKKLRLDTGQKIVDIREKLPSAQEFAEVAIAGEAKRGWYRKSTQALIDVFDSDAPRFAALLAALSPQTSVESNLVNALKTWTLWTKEGRPQSTDKILNIMAKSVQGSGTLDSVLGAWRNNSIEALTSVDPEKIMLSGPKVNSFMLNLRDMVNEVTNDAWMATFADIEQSMFSGSKTKSDPGKGPGYLAMSSRVREAAQKASELTGDSWTPAEIQETVWSFAKTLYEMRKSAEEKRTMVQIVKEGGLTGEKIGETPDFSSLLRTGEYRDILVRNGYEGAIAILEGAGNKPDRGNIAGAGKAPGVSEGKAKPSLGGPVEPTRGVLSSAKRLDAVFNRRLAESLANQGKNLESAVKSKLIKKQLEAKK
jgi:hypothetical protein